MIELDRLSGVDGHSYRPSAAERDARLDPKLVAAAHQFEASLLQELVKPLTSNRLFADGEETGSGGLSGLTSSEEGSGSTLTGFGAEALAKALSEKGGLGIARRVLDGFEAGTGAGAGVKGGEVTAEKEIRKLRQHDD